MIFVCSIFSYWHFKQFKVSPTKINLPNFEMPETDLEKLLYPEPEKEDYKEWISPDGKLKLKYSANWIETNEDFLSELRQGEVNLIGGSVLFFAFQFRVKDGALAFLTVEEISPPKNLEVIVKEMEKRITEKEGKMEIINLEQKDKIARLEIKMKDKKGINSRAKEEIIFNNDKAFSVVFTSFEKDWQIFEKEANEIFDSIQITF